MHKRVTIIDPETHCFIVNRPSQKRRKKRGEQSIIKHCNASEISTKTKTIQREIAHLRFLIFAPPPLLGMGLPRGATARQ